jgi:hypothetical protein
LSQVTNQPPYATGVHQSGTASLGSTITGFFTYNDVDNDLQGNSSYKWYRADDASGLNETLISGATSASYFLSPVDIAKYLRFAVIPVALSGATPGAEVKSATFLVPAVSCGNANVLYINHQVSGGVAPENKSIAYPTAASIAGEPDKCWITRNLGASRQALTVDDATEASAGWYWQFDRIQGYKHDGATRTPNIAWNSNVNGMFSWNPANDPCSLELGSIWRLPTLTEWINVDNAGSWVNWSGPFASALNLHAAGFLSPENGSLNNRGQNGYFWSSSMAGPPTAGSMTISSGGSNTETSSKTSGFPVRCVRDCTGVPTAPQAGTSTGSLNQVIWNWNTVAGATGYKWNTVNDFITATDMGSATTKTESGLPCNTSYTRYAWAYNGCGTSASTVLTTSTQAAPATPTSGASTAAATQIIWNWSAVTGAAGYKWNVVNDYSTATDMGTATTKTETGMTCNNSYQRFVWAYNACGNSAPLVLSQNTSQCCGINLTINHAPTGGVAPVSKFVIYSTVSNIPGEPSKCWITSNLGSDHQATTVIDATEASAGWYWQFNRKQGYKHDGVNRVPNTAWIANISESSDWQTATDPCTIELDPLWRLPTYTEWNNVLTSGGWGNITGAWNSGLKLHAAGDLAPGDGSLQSRGNLGYYWSSKESSTAYGNYLNLENAFNFMSYQTKSTALSIRCIREN